MSFNHFQSMSKRGKKTAFILNEPGFKLLPINFNLSFLKEENAFILSEFAFSFEVYIDFEHLYSIHFSYLKQRGRYSFELRENLDFRCEPIYEYGNEEEYLPNIKNIVLAFNETDIFNYMTQEIHKFYEKNPLDIQAQTIVTSLKNTWEEAKNSTKDLVEDTSMSEDVYNLVYFFNCLKKILHVEEVLKNRFKTL